MDRYVGLDAHAETCTLAVVGPSGRRLTSKVVETNGQALVEAIRSIPGRVHLCLEEGTQSAWLHEILEPEVLEIVVVSPPETRGAKDDLRDAWSRAEELRVGAIRTRVYKAPKHWAGLRSAATTYRMATQDVVRAKNRLKAVLRGRGILADAGVYEGKSRGRWLKELPAAGHRPAAEWLGRELDQLVPLRAEGASHHQEVIDRAGNGSASDGTVGGDRGHPAPVSDAKTVLELLRAGHRDPVVVGLDARPEREVDASGGSADSRAEPEATAGAEGSFQGCGHDGDHAAPRASSSYGLRADAAVGHQAEPGQAHVGPSARRDRAVDVEARGGVRPTASQAGDGKELAARVGKDDRDSWRFGSRARERFEGEHPFVSWSPGHDGEIPNAGYAPSEYRLKQWPNEALSGAWCPRFSGGAIGFDIERVAGQTFHPVPSRTSSPPMPVVTIGASPAPRSYRIHRSPVAGSGAGAQVNYSLDNSFLRS